MVLRPSLLHRRLRSSVLYQVSPILPGLITGLQGLGYLAAGLAFYLEFVGADNPRYFLGTVVVFGGINFVTSLFLPWIRRGATLRVVMILKLVVVFLIVYTLPAGGWVAPVVLGLFFIEVGLCFAFPGGLMFSGVLSVMLVYHQLNPGFIGVNQLSNPVEVDPVQLVGTAAVLLFMVILSSLAGTLLRRYNRLRRISDQQETSLQRLSEFNLKLQSYARRADEQSAERERRRISREIHDISGYIFTNLIAMMDATMSLGPEADLSQISTTLMAARKQAQEGLKETRSALRRLREVDPYGDKGLRMIYKIAGVFQQVTGTRVELSFGNLPLSFDSALNRSLYRIVQESLTNAIRHGKATEVGMQFWIHEEHLIMTIHDNGAGAKEITKGIGLAGMEERMGEMGGSIHAGNAPEGGFTLTIRIPLEQQGSTYRARGSGGAARRGLDLAVQ